MDTSDSMKKMLSALALRMNDEELVLSVLQGLIAAEITGRRIDKQMTQKDFAALLGVSQSTLSKWESGETNFTLSTLVSIASKLELDMQSPFVPASPKAYSPCYSKIVVFNPKGWSTSSSPVYSRAPETETFPILKEM